MSTPHVKLQTHMHMLYPTKLVGLIVWAVEHGK